MQTIAFTPCATSSSARCTFEALPIQGERGSSVVRCSQCGLGVTLPYIDDVAELYADRQSQDFQPLTAGLAETIKRIAFGARARAFLGMVPGKPQTIIDYGCGSGLFTKCLHANSDATVYALDFHDTPPAAIGDGEYRPFSRASELQGQADLLIASHVLEHEADPVALLDRMASLVKSGGHLLIEVPNIDCGWARVFGSHWDGWYLPYHRLHFSRKALREVVERAGLQIIDERGATVPTMGRTLANIARRPNNLFFLLVGAVLQPFQVGLEWVTNRPAALRIVARKL